MAEADINALYREFSATLGKLLAAGVSGGAICEVVVTKVAARMADDMLNQAVTNARQKASRS